MLDAETSGSSIFKKQFIILGVGLIKLCLHSNSEITYTYTYRLLKVNNTHSDNTKSRSMQQLTLLK